MNKGADWAIKRFIVKSHSGKPSKHHEVIILQEGAYLISYGEAVAYRSHDGRNVETYGEEGWSKTTRRYTEHFLLPAYGAPERVEAFTKNETFRDKYREKC